MLADNKDRLSAVAEDLAEAAFWNAGQNCTAGSRILVHSSLKDEFVELLAGRAKDRQVGDPADPETVIGPLIEPAALQRVEHYVRQAGAEGAVVRAGGSAVLAETGGWYFEPTVIDEVTPEMAIAREEVFGPVVAVLGFDTVEEAVALANDTEYGLAATVWSHDIDAAISVARRVRAGTVAVNGYSEGDITTPFGGYRMSGFGGRDNGLEAFDQYTEIKTIWVTLH